MPKEHAIQTVKEAIDAWGLGYAISTSNLDSNDIKGHEELSKLVETAYQAMREIRKIVDY